MKLKVALLQLLPTGTQKGNLEKGIAACKKARNAGADIALFPEMWNIGYTIPSDLQELNAMSITHLSGNISAPSPEHPLPDRPFRPDSIPLRQGSYL